MHCAQEGCPLTSEEIQALGMIPKLCPTCQHPLFFVITRDEASTILQVPLEEEAGIDLPPPPPPASRKTR
jgi:hypothetical protein